MPTTLSPHWNGSSSMVANRPQVPLHSKETAVLFVGGEMTVVVRGNDALLVYLIWCQRDFLTVALTRFPPKLSDTSQNCCVYCMAHLSHCCQRPPPPPSTHYRCRTQLQTTAIALVATVVQRQCRLGFDCDFARLCRLFSARVFPLTRCSH